MDLVKSPWGTEQLNEVLRTGEIGDEKVVLVLATYGTEKMSDLLENLQSVENEELGKYVLGELSDLRRW